MALTKEQAKEETSKLMKQYEKVVNEGKEKDYSELDVGSKFILPLFEKLGWDIKNINEVKEQKRTIVGPVDYSLNIDEKPKILVEIKKFENLDGYRTTKGRKQTYPEQAINYAWHVKADWAILSNFKETRLYYSHVREPKEGLIYKLDFSEYIEEFDSLWLLSKDAVISGILDTFERRRTRENIDIEILKDLYECRILLTNNIHLRNPELDKNLIRKSVQKILDRLIVIRVAEDRNIVSSDSILIQLEAWEKTVLNKEIRTFVMDLKNLFRDFDFSYNTSLFEEDICEELKIDNDIMKRVIERLYVYNFDMISSDVLGAVYENYIGHILEGSEKGIKITENRKKRKKFGIYYTPTHVVGYIVKNTLGDLLENETPDEVSNIRILDPACGSGLFLIKAFDYLKKYYEEHNTETHKNAIKNGSLEGYMNMIPIIEKKILTENLFGVDLDEQAGEIASVNLMLKALRKGEKLPLILNKNIKIGNSLISGMEEDLRVHFKDDWKDKKWFNWKEEFGEIMDKGGFDVIIGNPPYVEARKIEQDYVDYYRRNFETAGNRVNTFPLFIERAINLLKDGGFLGMIVHKNSIRSNDYMNLRTFILDNCSIIRIITLGAGVFEGVTGEMVILILQKVKDSVIRKKNIVLHGGKEIVMSPGCGVYQKIPQKIFYEIPGNRFNTYLNEEKIKILEKMRNGCIELRNIAETKQGIIVGNEEKYIAKCPESEKYKPILRGRNISRYNLKFDDEYLHYVPGTKVLTRGKTPGLFEKEEKILTQHVSGRIIATLDTDQFYVLQTINLVFSKGEISNYYLLSLLNSKLMNFYYDSYFNMGSEFTTAVATENLDLLPIKLISESEQKPFITLAHNMLTINKKLNTMHINFYEMARLTSETSKLRLNQCLSLSKTKRKGKILSVEDYEDRYLIVKDNDKNILRISFDDEITRRYVKLYLEDIPIEEVDKGNRRLSSRIQNLQIHGLNDLEYQRRIVSEYDEKMKKKKYLIKLRNDTDKAIDKMIYDLYGLTSEEIDIVEKSL
jgi:type I restriction-modification system DNA methylase subunit